MKHHKCIAQRSGKWFIGLLLFVEGYLEVLSNLSTWYNHQVVTSGACSVNLYQANRSESSVAWGQECSHVQFRLLWLEIYTYCNFRFLGCDTCYVIREIFWLNQKFLCVSVWVWGCTKCFLLTQVMVQMSNAVIGTHGSLYWFQAARITSSRWSYGIVGVVRASPPCQSGVV